MSRPVQRNVPPEEPTFGRRLDRYGSKSSAGHLWCHGWVAPRSWCVFLAIGMLLAFGCKDKARDAETADFARLYVRLRIVSSGMEGQPEKAREAREEVLRQSRTNLVGYRIRLRELQADPDRWVLFWDRVQFLADSIENKTKKKGR